MAAIPEQTLLSGYQVPCVGLGTWKSKPGEVAAAVKTAIGLGYRHFDCALIYGNEKEIGEAIKDVIGTGTVKREDLFITTKLWNTYHSKARVLEGCKESLTNLGLDYVDLYLIHWPMSMRENVELIPAAPDGRADIIDIDFTETWTAMQDLVDQGMCRSIGVSNFNSKQIQRILDLGLKHPLTCNQIEISPYNSNEKLLQFCKSKGISVVAYSPLGSGDCPWRKPDDPKLLEESEIVRIANQYNKSPGQVLLRWGIQRGYIIIPKSVSAARQKQNFEIFDFELKEDEMKIIYEINRNFRLCTWTGAVPDASHSPYYPFHEEF
ncbi:aldose reductase-like isoform X2 [Mizuhopecten yessoensis]|uniref:Alcohol dehydrogenase [NADP(+)] A n=1 Tax=Mizuhopecten yessoensis TaxID=6573 RepID=A0A210PP66_MIZYE|nr:aldose reductase-like isoform X1 [Mizuhopecten yessoensis]XP_021378511.1 aldose reductase-like isoform X2 [Mizuhopecten yessoensis]OWF38267.1 Alcohol dehydrogenase [NADP(+)] A [Mizuhopecten yessoensis]